MTKEQIQQLTKLQKEIDNLEEQIEIFYYNKSTDKDGNTIKSSDIRIFNEFHNKNIILQDCISEERCLTISKLIINSMEAELELLKVERDNYILSKPV